MASNRLAGEKSPYLLQHAQNPVDWFPWGEEAFAKSRAENKPIFLSIGYSTCHWCHVMERESFESEAIAAILNAHYVPVKVDREERPDVDRIYMLFVQASSGSGGWPMSVFLTPDLKPFFGGTYFPPDNRYGRPGFATILRYLADKWNTEREHIIASSEEVIGQLQEHVTAEAGAATASDAQVLDTGFQHFRRMFDSRNGGFGSAPKFPRPSVLNFLLRYSVFRKSDEAREMVLTTLREMAKGGMNDQLGGGFHRYSVDAHWFVPHFEKMLYDQAQLAIAYLEAYQLTRDESLAHTARTVLDYVLRDLTHPDGGFYSAEDADSVIDPAHPHEKGEGAFYIWSYQELSALLPPDVLPAFVEAYGVEESGNVEEDPHAEFTGRNILFQAEEPAVDLSEARATLLAARAHRPRPHLDDKVLTAWNGLMISAFAKAAQVLGESRYLGAAQRAVQFIQRELLPGGKLLRRFRDGSAAIPAFLDDYAFFAQGLIDLYEADFDPAHIALATELMRQAEELFADSKDGAFFSTAANERDLVMRLKDDYDGAEPSGNSITALVLLRLANLTKQEEFRATAERAIQSFRSRMASQPTGVPQMLVAFLLSQIPPQQIVLAGALTEPGAQVLLGEVRRRFLPFFAVLTPALASASDMQPVNGNAAAYVCQNFTCQLPVTSPAELGQLLPS